MCLRVLYGVVVSILPLQPKMYSNRNDVTHEENKVELINKKKKN